MFKFKILKQNDFTLLYQWFQEPAINQWYARGKHWSLEAIREKYEPRTLGQENVPSYIIYKNETPIGFIQYYQLEHSFPEGIHGQHNLLLKQFNQADLVGVDLFIADGNLRGQGFGNRIINQFIESFLSNFSAVVVDPEVLNSAAISCYTKSGFMKTSFSEDPNYLVMVKPLHHAFL